MFSFTSAAKTALAGAAIAGALALPLVGSSAAFAGDATFPPTAVADYYSTPQDTQIVVEAVSGLLANDSDGGNSGLIAGSIVPPAEGTLGAWQDGKFEFTPNPGFVGTAHFTYVASAGGCSSEPADVWIEVTAAPAEPELVGSPDFYTTPMDTPLIPLPGEYLMVNDQDVSLVSGIDDLTGEVVAQPDGSFVYTPAPGFIGTKTFSYFLDEDGKLPSEWILVTIQVTAPTSSVIPSEPTPGNPDDSVTTDSELPTLAYTGSDDVTVWLIAPAAALLALGAAGIWLARRRSALEH